MNDFKVSEKVARKNKAFIEAAIENYNNSHKVTKENFDLPFSAETKAYLEARDHHASVANRYTSFIETVNRSLVVEALYRILSESISDEARADDTSRSILRAMTNQYVQENGYYEILNRMKHGSAVLSEMYNVITTASEAIRESVDRKDPNTFTITSDMKDEFFKQLDYADTESVAAAIHDRVADAMNDFVAANTKDHEDITKTLQSAQEKIDSTSDASLKESYQIAAKRKTNAIRTAPKSVFHGMVSAMCESVLKNKDMHAEFMNEGHLDIDKIVSRTSLMYTFMEMLNTSRLEKVNASFIENTIASLKK